MSLWLSILKRNLKDYKLLFMMTVFPILLTVIFVGMFSAVDEISTATEIEAFTVAFESNREENDLAKSLKAYLEVLDQEGMIHLIEGEEADFKVGVDSKTSEIRMLTTQPQSKEAAVMETFIENYRSQYALAKVTGGRIAIPADLEVIQVEKVQGKDSKTPVVVTMLLFALLLGGNYGVKQILYMKQPVGLRAFIAPINRKKLYGIEFLITAFIITLSGMVVTTAFELIFKVPFSKQLGITTLIILVTSLLTTLLGTTIGLLFKDETSSDRVLSLFVTLSAMLSGGLTPQFDLGALTYLSPIRPITQALLDSVTTGNVKNVLEVTLSFGIYFVVLAVLSIWGLKRREA